MPVKSQIQNILNKLDKRDTLNILCFGIAHERYESTLAKTGHNFYIYMTPNSKSWNSSYADMPENYKYITELPVHLDFDLILCHTSDNNLVIAESVSKVFNLPLIRHTHTVPSSTEETIVHHQFDNIRLNTFISDYSKRAWGYENGVVIPHGLDTDFWCEYLDLEREPQCLSVVNLWQDRDWACGWNIWNDNIRNNFPTVVAGTNPGLSEAKGPEELRRLYNSNLIFVNTSLNSPIPMSLLEAMAGGCCVVSLATCMIPEIIQNGVNGILCNDGEEMKEACSFLLENPDKAKSLGIQARQDILDKFNLTNFKENWNNIFTEVLK